MTFDNLSPYSITAVTVGRVYVLSVPVNVLLFLTMALSSPPESVTSATRSTTNRKLNQYTVSKYCSSIIESVDSIKQVAQTSPWRMLHENKTENSDWIRPLSLIWANMLTVLVFHTCGK